MEFIIRYIFFTAAMLTGFKLSEKKPEESRHIGRLAAAFFIVTEIIFLI